MPAASPDYHKKWQAFSAVAIGVFLSTVDGSIVNIILPTLVKTFQTDFAIIQWVVVGYLLTVTTLMISFGRLADILGKKPLYTTGFIIFTIGSGLCAISPSVYWLIGFRVLQAIGAAMIMGLGMAIATEAFPKSERGKALGMIGSIVSVGIIIGPALGGLILNVTTWHWVFIVNVPVGVIGIYIVLKYVPHSKPTGHQKFDYLGALTFFISIISLLLALTFGQTIGFSHPSVLILSMIWFLFLIIFITIEYKSNYPMIDLKIFENTIFSVNLSTGFIAFIAVSGIMILLPFYLENILDLDILIVGLLLGVIPVMLGVISPISGILSDHYGSRRIAFFGLLVLIGGYAAISTLNENTTIWVYILCIAPMGIGMGLFQSPNNSAIMGAVSRDKLGVTSGLLSVSRTLGQTVGIATMGAFWSFRTLSYHQGSTIISATSAAKNHQVKGLQEMLWLITFLIFIALILHLIGWYKESKFKQQIR
ncbi:MAG: MFS transporter [Deltaproteobacteria bacterium]|nr:MFS transporter [Deltaproteobacteria bacterium]MBT4527856.1 MFS transporter [Deltaproteobacteria bacterium]